MVCDAVYQVFYESDQIDCAAAFDKELKPFVVHKCESIVVFRNGGFQHPVKFRDLIRYVLF